MKTTNLLNNSIAYIRLLVVKTKRWSQEIQIKLLLHQDYLRKIEQNESSKNLPYNYEVIYLEKLKPEWYWLIKAVMIKALHGGNQNAFPYSRSNEPLSYRKSVYSHWCYFLFLSFESIFVWGFSVSLFCTDAIVSPQSCPWHAILTSFSSKYLLSC